mgnify:CR=1 FL=1
MSPAKTFNLPSLAACEHTIGRPAATWVGQCYAIATLFVEAGLVPGGVAVYGHWLGGASPRSHFAERWNLPFINHGWVYVQALGRVVDPTRWTFEAVSPYVYTGYEPDDYGLVACAQCQLLPEEHGKTLGDCGDYTAPIWPYDEGGNKYREQTLRPPPVFDPAETSVRLDLRGVESLILRELLHQTDVTRVTLPQVHWIANLPSPRFRGCAPAFYAAITAAGHAARIPLDNARRAARDA